MKRERITKAPRKVVATYWLSRVGTIVKDGPEMSEVKWSDGSTADRFVANRLLVDPPPQRPRLKKEMDDAE